MGHAIATERRVGQRAPARVGLQEFVEIIIMARNPLAVAAQGAADLEPAPQAVENDDLVPEGSLCIDDHDIGDGEIDPRHVAVEIGPYRMQRVGIEG